MHNIMAAHDVTHVQGGCVLEIDDDDLFELPFDGCELLYQVRAGVVFQALRVQHPRRAPAETDASTNTQLHGGSGSVQGMSQLHHLAVPAQTHAPR